MLSRLQKFLGAYPWLLPLVSFVSGWAGYVLVRRGEGLAQAVALIALAGWPWLLVEPLIRKHIERRQPGIGNFTVNFITQSLQQELLFFSLPFIMGATQSDIGQWIFLGMVAAAALLTTLDPLYERWVAVRATRRFPFHAFCSWVAALVVVPMVLRLPVEQALPVSLCIVVLWLIVTLPLSLKSLRTWTWRVGWIASIAAVPWLIWMSRSQIPAAGLTVVDARITQSIEELEPGAAITTLANDRLNEGVIAYAAVRAPADLSQTIVFGWSHREESEQISGQIRGGRAQGYRTYSRKVNFPENSRGRWTVDIRTPQGQLLKRLRFVVS